MTELRIIAKSLQPIILTLTETWLTPSAHDVAALLPDLNFNTIFRTDRNNKDLKNCKEGLLHVFLEAKL